MAQSKVESRKPKGGRSQLQVNRFSFFWLCGKTQMLFFARAQDTDRFKNRNKKGINYNNYP